MDQGSEERLKYGEVDQNMVKSYPTYLKDLGLKVQFPCFFLAVVNAKRD